MDTQSKCGSWLASDGGVSVNMNVSWQTVIAGKPAPTGVTVLVGMARHFRPSATHQEVEIATLIRLQHMIDVQLTIAADQ
ncbi:hypothetical protein FCH79_06945 [Pseudomonas koreensis]|nr:hypothetical protein [Pseudomonas koreensis]